MDKENESDRFHERKASTAENESEKREGEIKMQSERERSIFSMPENKFKLSELMKWGGKYRRNLTKECLNSSLRMNDKLSYNRIL